MKTIRSLIKELIGRKHQKKLSWLLENLLGSISITLLDVGAAGGAHPRWAPYRKHIDLFAVEPDPRSINSIARKVKNRSETVIEHGLWSETCELNLYLCRKPEVSSLFIPNTEFLRNFPNSERFDILDQKLIRVSTIDTVANDFSVSFDLIKLDIQGAELAALTGGVNALRTSLAVEVEVEFTEIYRSQPLFDEVFGFLKSNNMEFIDFLSLYRWSPKQFGVGQTIFADALFMRSPETISSDLKTDLVDLKKYVLICAAYDRGDLILRLAESFKERVEMCDFYSQILDIGLLVHARNLRNQNRLALLSRLLMVKHISARGHVFN